MRNFVHGRSVSIWNVIFCFAAPKPSPLLINFRGSKNIRAVKAHFAKPLNVISHSHSVHMKHTILNTEWNAEPNAPCPEIEVIGDNVSITFFLNHFLYQQFNEGDKGKLIFSGCKKYSFNSMNDEGYFRGQYRFSNDILPWGEFYLLSDADSNFPKEVQLTNSIADGDLKHYIFFFRDNTFECLADSCQFIPKC